MESSPAKNQKQNGSRKRFESEHFGGKAIFQREEKSWIKDKKEVSGQEVISRYFSMNCS